VKVLGTVATMLVVEVLVLLSVIPLKVTTFELAKPVPAMVRVTGLLPLTVTREIVCALARDALQDIRIAAPTRIAPEIHSRPKRATVGISAILVGC
jgi:hypothetical protein